jgi:hypothetical protein
MPKYLFDSPINELILNKQGYWLEWYIWKQLKEFNFSLGRRLVTTGDSDKVSFEVDGILINDDQCIILECKDTQDLKDTLPNLPLISRFADKWVLIATKEIRDSDIKKARSILGDKFVYITPKDVDNVKSIVEKLLKRKTLFNGF